MKIIEHVMLFSYLGEKKKGWKGKRFSKDMLKYVTSQSLVSVSTFFSDSCFVKLRKVSAVKKKMVGKGSRNRLVQASAKTIDKIKYGAKSFVSIQATAEISIRRF